MKLMKRLLALCAVLALLCGCAVAEEAAAEIEYDSYTVLASVNGAEITVGRTEYYAYLLYYYGYTEIYPDYELALDALIQQEVMRAHMIEAGYYDFTDEELEAFRNEAAAEWEDMLEDYVVSYLTEDTEEQRATLREQAIQYFNSIGSTEESIYEELLYLDAQERMDAELTDGYVPAEDEIQAVFEEYGAEYQEMYEGNVALYEYYTMYFGADSWYVPEGYRAVIHILLGVDEELLNAYQEAQLVVEELFGQENPDEAALDAACKAADEAFNAVLASRQDDIDTIMARLENGESFQALIAEYGEDPGMEDEQQLAEGYKVHQESVVWDPAFVDGAFQPDMQKPGDVSRPVVGSNGIHIIYYLSDVPGGLVMRDDIRQLIEEYLVDVKINTIYNEQYADWLAKAE
ncbi:MAG: peptidylprolyl isomerase, partial [Clostridia bacterium]|nr:peptidylprolyl isomerase [Clostridia bacterium]